MPQANRQEKLTIFADKQAAIQSSACPRQQLGQLFLHLILVKIQQYQV
jgi:hypothetical protein